MASRGAGKLDRAGRRFGWSVLVVLVLAPVLLLARGRFLEKKKRPRESRERVAHVVDGDTLRLAGGERVRLAGIDAPEMREGKPGRSGPFPEPGAVEATEALRSMAENETVRVIRLGEDRYGRTLAKIYLSDGTDVGGELVRRGLAARYQAPGSRP
ncbi:MAG: thermonuclease family protein [Planctomycetota bacterium]|jgi:endonuclease YncB( thermonuclease family)